MYSDFADQSMLLHTEDIGVPTCHHLHWQLLFFYGIVIIPPLCCQDLANKDGTANNEYVHRVLISTGVNLARLLKNDIERWKLSESLNQDSRGR